MINQAAANASSGFEQRLKHALENQALEVPMLPEVARKAVQLAEDPNGDASSMAKLIQGDQTLAAQVIRIANSAMYNPAGASMVSLQQAITRLGMKLLAEIAVAASLHAKLFDVPGYEDHVSATLKRALASGLWAKEIARAARKNVEAAFLGGLLHDIGRPVVLQLAVELARRHKLALSESEICNLETKYQRSVGTRVVNAWKMPSIVCSVVEHFGSYKELNSSHQTQVMIAMAGALFADCFDRDETADENKAALLESDLMADLNFYQDDIEALFEKADVVNTTVGSLSL